MPSPRKAPYGFCFFRALFINLRANAREKGVQVRDEVRIFMQD
jgi:hypothetical protein